ncbi:hypothetical protein VZT92_002051 [Zoarces viviparus]|uniref:Secreted protein n=1 Tax=Zoarces viviparus TaxID=48416 RepID=A0AAW1G7D3_ZOAVI
MSLSQGCWWMALATARATKSQAADGAPSVGPDGTVPPRPCQHLLPRHFVLGIAGGNRGGPIMPPNRRGS